MARSLPLFIAATATQVTTSASVPGATSALSYGDTGVLIHGFDGWEGHGIGLRWGGSGDILSPLSSRA